MYYYRFKAGQHVSESGSTRTAPTVGAALSAIKVGVVNCQDWQNGYWPAYENLADEDLDLVLHLGDYIYEYDPESVYPDREHNLPETPGLDQLLTLTRQLLPRCPPTVDDGLEPLQEVGGSTALSLLRGGLHAPRTNGAG